MKIFRLEDGKLKINLEIPMVFCKRNDDEAEAEPSLIDQVGFRLTPSPVIAAEESAKADQPDISADVYAADQSLQNETVSTEEEKNTAENETAEIVDSDSKKKPDFVQRRHLIKYFLPVLILALLILATVPSYISRKNSYSAAQKLFDAGDYAGARSGFEALGAYSDSSKKVAMIDAFLKEQALEAEAEEKAKKEAQEKAAAAIAKAKAEKLKAAQQAEEQAKKELQIAEAAREKASIDSFYEMLHSGALQKAYEWLNSSSYSSKIENREKYLELISYYLPMCKTWGLYRGDSTLLPRSAGVDTKCGELISSVSIFEDKAILHLSAPDGSYAVDLTSEPGEMSFVKLPDLDPYYYYVFINMNNNLAYVSYTENGKVAGSCEYSPQ